MIPALRNVTWWVRDYAYALVWQARAQFSRTDAESFLSGGRAPIVVLPGVYESWKFMQPLVEQLHQRGHPVHVIEVLKRNRRPIAELADQVTDYLQRRQLDGVILVAHSKGGLAGKLVMTGAAGARVRGLVAIATPFGGSKYARLMPIRTLRAFAPADPLIMSLARELTVNASVVSIYGRFDPHIPEGSELLGAKNVLLETGGHFRILAHPRVIAEVSAFAEQ